MNHASVRSLLTLVLVFVFAAAQAFGAPNKLNITTQPISQSAVVGQSVTFSVTAKGATTIYYQWKKGGVSITGATSSTYTIPSVRTTDAGTYAVTVSSPNMSSVNSNSATLTVNTPPSITTQPVGATVAAGAAVSFKITASGSGTLTYQWYLNGVAITGATSATYSISAAAPANAGSYTATVRSNYGSATSSAATLTVIQAPVITTQPLSLLVNAGNPASFSVTATSSVAATYQWYKSGVAISGATSSSFSIPSTASTDSATYTVSVTNLGGTVTSAGASLAVNATPTYNRMCKMSTRTLISAANPTTIVGFVTEGSNTRNVLIRGVGPGLAKYGVANPLATPLLELHATVNGVDTVLASNTHWTTDPLAPAAIIEANAFPLDAGSYDTAIVITLSPGAYTIMLSGVGGSTGTALVEIYELP